MSRGSKKQSASKRRNPAKGVPPKRRLERPKRTLWKALPYHWRLVLSAFLATRLVLFIFAWMLHRLLGDSRRYPDGHFFYHGGEYHANWLVDAFQKWDAYWFLNIVREGHQYYGPVEQMSGVTAGAPETNITPFPLYPLLMKVGGWIVGDPAIAGLIISQVCLLVAMVWLYKLVTVDHSEQSGIWAVWLFAAFPATYAFSAIYSESLYVMLTIGAVLALRRGHPVLAGLAGMGAALTRLPGAFIVIVLFLEIWKQRAESDKGLIRSLWPLVLVPGGTLLYFGYLWWLTGEPMAYFIGQEGWHKETVGPWYHLVHWFQTPVLRGEDHLHIFTTAIMAATLVMGYGRIRTSYWVYALASSLMLLSSSGLIGLPRYAGAIFPFFVIWAGLSKRHPGFGRSLLVMFAMGAIVCFWVWTTWRYAF